METILKVRNIEKYFGRRGTVIKAIDNISFEVIAGEFVGIMGPSGSGKTTLLNCISTIDSVTAGHIFIDNYEVTSLKTKYLEKFRRENLGFIFQDFNLLDTLTAYENIALALTILDASVLSIDRRVKDISRKLGIYEILNKFPYEMSGGQRQRVAAARSIIKNPSLVLADEPTGSLDSKSSRALLECLEYLNNEHNTTLIMVTHDAFAASYCKSVMFIRDGKIFNKIIKGNDTRKDFFKRIIEITTLLGGDFNNVF